MTIELNKLRGIEQELNLIKEMGELRYREGEK
jgi:hypothetical protein